MERIGHTTTGEIFEEVAGLSDHPHPCILTVLALALRPSVVELVPRFVKMMDFFVESMRRYGERLTYRIQLRHDSRAWATLVDDVRLVDVRW